MLINNIRKSPTCPIRNTIHAPTRGATCRLDLEWSLFLYFNPRSYKRSDYTAMWQVRYCQNFNPRSYKRSDEERWWQSPRLKTFNPRSYKRSDVMPATTVQRPDAFNPRSYKRSDSVNLATHVCSCLSIHAPTRGATRQLTSSEKKFYLSIHAPTRGATSMSLAYPILKNFQSTLLQEERQFCICLPACCIYLSIHAPTRGATMQISVWVSRH